MLIKVKYYWIPCNSLQYHWIPSKTIKYHRIPMNTIEYQNTTEYHRIPFNTIQYHKIPSNTIKYHQIPSIIRYHHNPVCYPRCYIHLRCWGKICWWIWNSESWSQYIRVKKYSLAGCFSSFEKKNAHLKGRN